jgi:hypothetical protein
MKILGGEIVEKCDFLLPSERKFVNAGREIPIALSVAIE